MKYVWVLFVGAMTSCSQPDRLEVDSFHLRNLRVADKDAGLVRGDQLKRLHGAISVSERKQRLGQYYTALWRDDEVMKSEGKIIFEYQQASSGAKVWKQERRLEAGLQRGKEEFAVNGESYSQRGRVVTWRMSYFRDGKRVDSKQSYLWR